ncbi:hypothetical protein KKG22_04740 [Patescibacteria group bacterium]|nr:hypothetical protein [Patescibacteria group bacterium]MBU1721643.1 hypothetical protein [Patescibacteria group bacterium]MBU1901646.1 hypothetical protein [Patescibacteria group bacterium]
MNRTLTQMGRLQQLEKFSLAEQRYIRLLEEEGLILIYSMIRIKLIPLWQFDDNKNIYQIIPETLELLKRRFPFLPEECPSVTYNKMGLFFFTQHYDGALVHQLIRTDIDKVIQARNHFILSVIQYINRPKENK